MEHKNEVIFHTILRIIVLIAVIGLIALLISKRNAGPSVAFDLLAYIVSITALVLTTLQSISIARQVRITRHAAGKITEAVNKINELAQVNEKLSKTVAKGQKLDEAIAEVLSYHAVGASKEERQKITRSIIKKLR